MTIFSRTASIFERFRIPEDGPYRGINVVCDEPAGNVPDPGGLPGAEPLTAAPPPGPVPDPPNIPGPGTLYRQGGGENSFPWLVAEERAGARGPASIRITIDRFIPQDSVITVEPSGHAIVIRLPEWSPPEPKIPRGTRQW